MAGALVLGIAGTTLACSFDPVEEQTCGAGVAEVPLAEWGEPTPGSTPAVAWQLIPGDVRRVATSSLAVIDDLLVEVYASCDVVAVDSATGTPRWVTATKTNASQLSKVGNDIVLGGTTRIDPASGEAEEGDPDDRRLIVGGWGVSGIGSPDEVFTAADLDTSTVKQVAAPWASDPLVEEPSAPPDVPSVIDDDLYLPKRSTGKLYAVDLDGGEPLWSSDFYAAGIRDLGEVGLFRERLVACAEHADLGIGTARFDRASGELISFLPFEPANHATSCNSGPLLQVGELLIYGGATGLWGVDLATGEPRWNHRGGSFSRPAVVGQRIYVGRLDDELLTLDPATGAILHVEEDVPVENTSVPIVTNSGLLVISGSGVLTALRPEHLQGTAQ